MSLPQYLQDNREKILIAQDQQIALWTNSYEKYRTYDVVESIYRKFPDRNMQRNDVVQLLREDHYTGFVAAMMWGGINATRPARNGGACPFERLLNHPEENVISAIEYAAEQIKIGNLRELFQSFENGAHKLPGVGPAYFTKLFFFLGELVDDLKLKPLVFDKWMANAHCALLIQSLPPNKRNQLPYKRISLTNKYTVIVPNGDEGAFYNRYLNDMKVWAEELLVPVAKLEEFLFGKSLKSNGQANNPRLELWKIILSHICDIEKITNVGNVQSEKKPGSSDKGESIEQGGRNADEEISELAPNAKYFPLQEYFRKCKRSSNEDITLTIEQIEEILRNKLPDWAFKWSAGFWGNSAMKVHVQKRAWLLQGYIVTNHTISGESRNGEVTFRLVAPLG